MEKSQKSTTAVLVFYLILYTASYAVGYISGNFPKPAPEGGIDTFVTTYKSADILLILAWAIGNSGNMSPRAMGVLNVCSLLCIHGVYVFLRSPYLLSFGADGLFKILLHEILLPLFIACLVLLLEKVVSVVSKRN